MAGLISPPPPPPMTTRSKTAGPTPPPMTTRGKAAAKKKQPAEKPTNRVIAPPAPPSATQPCPSITPIIVQWYCDQGHDNAIITENLPYAPFGAVCRICSALCQPNNTWQKFDDGLQQPHYLHK